MITRLIWTLLSSLYGPCCRMSPERPLNLITHSLSLPCWGAAGWKHFLALMPQDWWKWQIKWMKSVSMGRFQYKSSACIVDVIMDIRHTFLLTLKMPWYCLKSWVYNNYLKLKFYWIEFCSFLVNRIHIFLVWLPNICITPMKMSNAHSFTKKVYILEDYFYIFLFYPFILINHYLIIQNDSTYRKIFRLIWDINFGTRVSQL